MRRYRIAILTIVPSPHQVEFFDALSKHPGIDLTVYYCSRTLKGRSWKMDPGPGHRGIVLRGLTLGLLGPDMFVNPGILGICLRERYNLFVVSGYTTPTMQMAMWALSAARRPWVYWGERTKIGDSAGLRHALAKIMFLGVRLASRGVLAIGTRAARTFRRLLPYGPPVYSHPYYCSVGRYLQAEPRAELRRRLLASVSPEATLFLFNGQLIRRKACDTAIRAFGRLTRGSERGHLAVLGDGPERETLARFAADVAPGRVHFLGFQDWDALPSFYHASDVFVFPSRYDGWGMVVNEALAAGLPVITTDAVGAAHDLVRDGENGFILPVDDVDAFAGKMHFFLKDRGRIERFGRAARRTMLDWTPEKGAERLYRIVKAVLAGRQRRHPRQGS